ncbi:hypothetical protein TNCV_3062391 [Trichonephila clavipes]|nr:hypothetical protein TNCV_3062391 [Trichonephila clavipes]
MFHTTPYAGGIDVGFLPMDNVARMDLSTIKKSTLCSTKTVSDKLCEDVPIHTITPDGELAFRKTVRFSCEINCIFVFPVVNDRWNSAPSKVIHVLITLRKH